jgi:DNA polymerase elongation subunit (family B)
MTTHQEPAWLLDASYEGGRVILRLLRSESLDPFRWDAPDFHPYYLTKESEGVELIKKRDLFTGYELTLGKVSHDGRAPKSVQAWEAEIDPALSCVYDNGLRFGILHDFENNRWVPRTSLSDDGLSRFQTLFGIEGEDRLKHGLLKETYSYVTQAIPRVGVEKLGLPEGSEEDYYNAFLLSRIANLPLSRTYRTHKVSEWIRSMLHTYYRAHGILIPNADELKLGDRRKFVAGALTIAPESGTYFNMQVLDFESLYPGCIDVFNLSYETVRCTHQKCQQNKVPGLDYHVCTKKRGIYSALIGALRDLRIRLYKPTARLSAQNGQISMDAAAARILKLFLVSSFGVTIRIHGLASPLLGEAITAYGRYVLQSTWDIAKGSNLRPRYGDTDSVFLDNPVKNDVDEFIRSIGNRFGLELAYDRIYSVCVLSAAKKAYFGLLPEGEHEIKGLSIAKSNSPRFFEQTFKKCLAQLSEGRNSRSDFDQAKARVPEVVEAAIRDLRQGKVNLSDLEYRVELRDDPNEKSRSKTLPQAYQAAWLLGRAGKNMSRGEVVGFVKVRSFKVQGRQFTVKPTLQTSSRDVNVEDYIRNLISSLNQTFEPMSIKFNAAGATLSDFL